MKSRETYNDRTPHYDCARGITLIELVIVLGIASILMLASFPLSARFQSTHRLDNASSLLAQTLRIARERSVAGIHDHTHGVFIDNDPQAITESYTLFEGASYATRSIAYDRVVTLPSSLEITTSLSGTQEILFDKGLGTATFPESLHTIEINDGTGHARTITVHVTGLVEG